MNNSRNLIPNTARTPSEVRANTRKGGIRSGEVRRRKKALRETIEMLLRMPCTDEEVQEELHGMGLSEREMTNQTAIVVAMLRKAMQGDVQAFNTLRDTAGQKPTDQTEVMQKIAPTDKPLTMREAKAVLQDIEEQI